MSFNVTTITQNIQNQASNFEDQIGSWLGKTVRPICEKIVPTNPIVTVSILVGTIGLLAFSLYRSYTTSQKLSENNSKLSEKNSILSENIIQLESELETVKLLEKLNKANKKLNTALNEEITELHKQLNDAELFEKEDHATFMYALSLKDTTIKKLVVLSKINTKNFDSELNEARTTINELENEIENLKKNNDELSPSYQNKLIEISTEKAKLSLLNELDNKEIQNLKNELKESANEIEELNKKIEKLKRQNDKLDKELEEEYNDKDKMAKNFNLENKNLTKTNYKLIEENNDLSDQIKNLTNQLSAISKKKPNRTLSINEKYFFSPQKNNLTEEKNPIDLSRSVFGL